MSTEHPHPFDRGVWESRAGRRRVERFGRSTDANKQNWGALVRGGAVSAERRAYASVQSPKSKVEKSPESEVQSPESEAEECFQKAIEVARRQRAKSLELRAVMSLARLWQSQGKKEEAHRMLAEIYGWFTEGFDTKDLQKRRRRCCRSLGKAAVFQGCRLSSS